MKTALLALALLAVSALSSADSLRSQMEAMNKSVNAALKSKDIEAFRRAVQGRMTSDFKYWDDGGKPMGMDAMVAGMRQGLGMYQKVMLSSSEILSVKESGNKGTAIERDTLEGMVAGPDKKMHKMKFVGTSTETFRKVKGKWMMATMSMKTDKMTMDGKPMPMNRGH